MKKSLKIIIPLAIAAVLLFAVGYYILIYRSGLSAAHYMARGDRAMASESYERAVRNYNHALSMSNDDDPQISIALAEAYKALGKYTRAEYTLVSAITEHPDDTSLYVALSKAYIEQGKFLDADRMLSRAANESVKAELEKMRPQPPTMTPDSGYYATYISISASCPAGRIFMTTDGSYPSNDSNLYTEPIPLPVGETTICALVVDDSGLVSPAVYAGYTIGGIIEPVTLADAALDAAVRTALDKTVEDVLMSNELWNIEELEVKNLQDAADLSRLTGLKKLTVAETAVSDFTVLEKLTNLEYLDLSRCILSSATVNAVGKLSSLTELYLHSCAINNAAPFASLTKLTALDLSDNVISDVAPLAACTKLETLNLHNNPVTKIDALSSCTALKELDVSNDQLSSLDAVSGMKQLTKLNANANQLTTLAPIAGCTALEELDVAENQITDISILPKLPALATFDGSYNKITAIPVFDTEAKLHTINLNYNEVQSVEGLKDVIALNYVKLEFNKVADLTPLETCYNLVQVDVWDNPVSDASVKALQDHSIIVNYNPN